MNILKRKAAFLIAAVFTAANVSYIPMLANAEDDVPFVMYDTDGDNEITVMDLQKIHQMILSGKSADCDFDVFDEIILKNFIINPDNQNNITTSETTYEITQETSSADIYETVISTDETEIYPDTSEPEIIDTEVPVTVTTEEYITTAESVLTDTESLTTEKETTDAAVTTSETTASISETTSETTVTTEDETNAVIINTDLRTEDNGYIYALAQHQTYAPTPSIGDVKSCVIMFEFADSEFTDNCYSPDEVHELLFGSGDARLYPYNSFAEYYERASYGRLNITGDIYRTKINLDFNADADDAFVLNTLKKVLTSLDSEVDFSQYDSDNDGIIDHVVFIPAIEDDNAMEWGSAWWSRTLSITGNLLFDNTNFKTMIVDHYQPLSDNITQRFLFLNTVIHETGHAVGLPDYYSYDGSTQDIFNGDAGFEIMESATGDFSAFSKLMAGWYQPNEVQIFKDDISTYYIGDSASVPSCLILPVGTMSSKLASEYFVVEYITNTNNNINAANKSGIRIWHADAETKKVSGMVNLWIYNNMYSTSVRDLLALVNNGNGFFDTGDVVSGETVDDFFAYDSSGNVTVETGYSIKIGDLQNGKYEVTVTKN
ncbi:MAG: hypothetical protein ACI4JM_09890 [Oscillospiraceae bacterium]